MFEDDNETKKKPPFQIGQDLSDFSVDDLDEIITELRAEIERLTTDKAGKQASKNAADALFKS